MKNPVNFDDCGAVYQGIRLYCISKLVKKSIWIAIIKIDDRLFLALSELPIPQGELFYIAGIELYPGDTTVYELKVPEEEDDERYVEMVKSERTESELEQLIQL